jgi:valyl-tRNA synthetase
MLDKHYQHTATEAKHYAAWEGSGTFTGQVTSNKQPYTIMLPPPNVTGSLHAGHALDHTIQDVLIRYHRMKGMDALWMPGTDHAGIATQMIVERQLEAKGLKRRELGREEFLKKVWEWKEQSGSTITRQMRRLGDSADWSRERFTMDDGLSRAVLKVFVTLFKKGLIYKAKRLVNWHPGLQTAVSDLEVMAIPTKGNLWHIRYDLKDGSGHLVVATTRPETMLGDVAVAVHPEDERYKHMIGKTVVLPLVGRELPVIGDSYIDKETGTGAMKVTPAHDFNDFAMGERHKLPMLAIFDSQARVNDNAPEKYRGLDRFEARKIIVAELEELGLLVKVEPWTSSVPHDEKSKSVIIEPFLTDQWYCDAATLALPAIKAVEEGRIKLVPKAAEKTFFEWMRNIQPWCISRQIWWGHQIPAWYDDKGNVYVEESEAEAQAKAGAGVKLTRDNDVLDTWFSSALWPFSTLGWPDKTPEVSRYYPGNVLVTGVDIIFFWVARMMMMGIEFMGEVPFKTVFFHGLVRDPQGAKMSKTKGNVLDPIELMDQFGADSLRFTLMSQAGLGRDLKLGPQHVENYRNFITKIWNAARYCEMNEVKPAPNFDPATAKHPLNRWIANEVRKATGLVDAALAEYRFNDAASALYQFVYGSFCDWYLEFTKPILMGTDEAAKTETRTMTGWALEQMLRLLHPFIPFVTEELWQQFGFSKKMLIAESWPELGAALAEGPVDEINWLVSLISAVRSLRAEFRINPAEKINLLIGDAAPGTAEKLARQQDLITRLARVNPPEVTTLAPPKGSIVALIPGATVIIPLAGVIDLDAERARLQKEIAKLDDEITKLDARLSNDNFLAKAGEEAIEEQKERRTEAAEAKVKLSEALKRLA